VRGNGSGAKGKTQLLGVRIRERRCEVKGGGNRVQSSEHGPMGDGCWREKPNGIRREPRDHNREDGVACDVN
jgi:hypothetical protein